MEALRFYRIWKNKSQRLFRSRMPTLRQGGRRRKSTETVELEMTISGRCIVQVVVVKGNNRICAASGAAECLGLVAKMLRHFDLYF